ncbi:MAG: dermonecrotic toxin domain-containing protein, partial [Pseudomonas sp.]
MQPTQPLNPHLLLIKERLPRWSQHATADNWRSLGQALAPAQGFADALAPWFANAAPDLREAVLASSARLDAAQHALAQALKGLKQIAEFAEPLLTERLFSDHQLAASVRTSELIRVRHLFTWQTYVSEHERHSLLEAALQNFADDVEFSPDSALALAGDIQVSKTRVVGKAPLGDSETLVDYPMDSEAYSVKALPLSPADFARTCRDLDLGRRYQQHLSAIYAPAQVAGLAETMYQAQLRLDADIAFMRHRLSGVAMDALIAHVDGQNGLTCQQLSLFGLTLHEVVVIDTVNAGLLLHVPGHEAALRQFHTLEQLHQQLCHDLLDPALRRHFCAYLAHDLHPAFLSRLQQNLDATGTTPADQQWSLRDGADLHLTLSTITAPLFTFRHDEHVARIKAQARLFAVPTAEADEQARRRRLAQWTTIGLDALMVAGFFVPTVGALMLAITAYQLLDEVFEAYQAWHIGDRQLALQHVQAVGINLALIAGLH